MNRNNKKKIIDDVILKHVINLFILFYILKINHEESTPFPSRFCINLYMFTRVTEYRDDLVDLTMPAEVDRLGGSPDRQDRLDKLTVGCNMGGWNRRFANRIEPTDKGY